MKLNIPQKICVLFNKEKKWVACFKHNENSLTMTKYKSSLKYWMLKAKYLHKKLKNDIDGDTDDRHAKANIILALDATDYKGWEEVIYKDTYVNAKALIKQYHVLAEYNKKGYQSISKVISITDGSSKIPNTWNKKWDMGKAPKKETIMRHIAMIELFLNTKFSKNIKNKAYYAVVGIERVGREINSRGQLYHYLKELSC